MNSTEIAKRLAKITEHEQGIELMRACDRRRTEIKDRLYLILPRPHDSVSGQTPLRQQAALDGLEALQKLDAEIVSLNAELDHCTALESQCNEAAERCRMAGIKDAAPRSVKAVPRAASRVRDALRALDTELDGLNRELNLIAEYVALPGVEFPFNDSETAELLQLRNEVWTTRTVAALLPMGVDLPAPGNYPQSVKLAFRWVDSQSFTSRRGPRWPPAEADHPGPQQRRRGMKHGNEEAWPGVG